jgi:hypothetical protein
MDLMTDIDTLACDVHEVADGVLVIPHVLPVFVPWSALSQTVGEWIGARSG